MRTSCRDHDGGHCLTIPTRCANHRALKHNSCRRPSTNFMAKLFEQNGSSTDPCCCAFRLAFCELRGEIIVVFVLRVSPSDARVVPGLHFATCVGLCGAERLSMMSLHMLSMYSVAPTDCPVSFVLLFIHASSCASNRGQSATDSSCSMNHRSCLTLASNCPLHHVALTHFSVGEAPTSSLRSTNHRAAQHHSGGHCPTTFHRSSASMPPRRISPSIPG